jgi:hypothetical protein
MFLIIPEWLLWKSSIRHEHLNWTVDSLLHTV